MVRVWLYPGRHLQALQGWVSVGWLIVVLLFPSAVAISLAVHQLRAGLWLAVVALLFLLFLALSALWQHVPRAEPTVSYQPNDDHHGFVMTLHKPGKSLPNAAIRLIVPAEFGWVHRQGAAEDMRSAKTLPDGSQAWDETGLVVTGGGSYPTEWRFQATVPPGDHLIRLIVSDDTLVRSVEREEVMHVPPSERWDKRQAQQRAQQRAHVSSIRDRLREDEETFLTALRTGIWPQDSPSARRGDQAPRLGPFIKIVGDADKEIVHEGLAAAQGVCVHYKQLLNQARGAIHTEWHRQRREASQGRGQDPGPVPKEIPEQRLVPNDGIEHAVLCVRSALSVLDSVLDGRTT